MTGLVKVVVNGYENRSYTKKTTGEVISGRRVYFSGANPEKGAVGEYCNTFYSTSPEVFNLNIGDEIVVFRDDFNRSYPVRFVPDAF